MTDKELDGLCVAVGVKLTTLHSQNTPPRLVAQYIDDYMTALDKYVDARALRVVRLTVVDALRETYGADHK